MPFQSLDRLMSKSGRPQFSQDVFQSVFDYDDRIQHIVKDFDEQGLVLGTEEPADTETRSPEEDDSSKTVSKMAQQATDI